MKYEFYLRIGNGEPKPFVPSEHPEIVRKLNRQAMRALGYEPDEPEEPEEPEKEKEASV